MASTWPIDKRFPGLLSKCLMPESEPAHIPIIYLSVTLFQHWTCCGSWRCLPCPSGHYPCWQLCFQTRHRRPQWSWTSPCPFARSTMPWLLCLHGSQALLRRATVANKMRLNKLFSRFGRALNPCLSPPKTPKLLSPRHCSSKLHGVFNSVHLHLIFLILMARTRCGSLSVMHIEKILDADKVPMLVRSACDVSKISNFISSNPLHHMCVWSERVSSIDDCSRKWRRSCLSKSDCARQFGQSCSQASWREMLRISSPNWVFSAAKVSEKLSESEIKQVEASLKASQAKSDRITHATEEIRGIIQSRPWFPFVFFAWCHSNKENRKVLAVWLEIHRLCNSLKWVAGAKYPPTLDSLTLVKISKSFTLGCIWKTYPEVKTYHEVFTDLVEETMKMKMKMDDIELHP